LTDRQSRVARRRQASLEQIMQPETDESEVQQLGRPQEAGRKAGSGI
jgi:hypothetical protein